MKYADINRRFTEIVTEYIRNGYTINTATMNGSQSEVTRIDLSNGKNFVRILIRHFYHKDGFYNDGYEIVVGNVKKAHNANQPPEGAVAIIWNNELNIVACEEFYEIGKRHGYGEWYGTRDDAVAARNTRAERVAQNCYVNPIRKDEMTDSAIPIAERYIRRVVGTKRPNRAKIAVRHATKWKNNRVCGQYIVIYNGKSYDLH